MEPISLAIAVLALLLGGVLKGVIGAGAPVVAVPIISMLYGVHTAVCVLLLPNLFSNLMQAWQFRKHLVSPKFALLFAGSGALGAGIGSLLLAGLPAAILMRIVAFIVVGYVVFRLLRPAWKLSQNVAMLWAAPAGLIAGIMQGAGGISAPVSLTFLNALKLERRVFMATVSIFFVAMKLVQIPALLALGVMTPERLNFSILAIIPLLAGMPIGTRIARHVPAYVFDKLLLALLSVVALKLIFLPNV
ncbi:sulfite exporter TauE/SafE family protein [Ascidiaceihabitans sp.]|nr:sulfite exporter TauE/SafE family protein [Ascidiaceihabitans sp.]